jgi:hypothetical protein
MHIVLDDLVSAIMKLYQSFSTIGELTIGINNQIKLLERKNEEFKNTILLFERLKTEDRFRASGIGTSIRKRMKTTIGSFERTSYGANIDKKPIHADERIDRGAIEKSGKKNNDN